MPIAMPTMIDPLKSFVAGASSSGGRPIPLVSTRFDVDIDGGFATVVTKRVFRNDETQSIEATITFPVPVHAVLYDLEARIEGRTVKARAQRSPLARMCPTKDSYSALACSGRAAASKDGRLPRRTSPNSVNCDTASTAPPAPA